MTASTAPRDTGADVGIVVAARERGRSLPWLSTPVSAAVSLIAMLFGGVPYGAELGDPYCELALVDRAGNRAVVRRCRRNDLPRLRRELEDLVDGATLAELRERFGLSDRFGSE